MRMWATMALLLASPDLSAVALQRVVDAKIFAVSLDKLLSMPELYDGKAVRTSGDLDVTVSRRGPVYTLRGGFGGRVVIQTSAEADQPWAEQAPRWIGDEVEVTGLVSLVRPGTERGAPPPLTDPDTGGAAIYITIWAFLGPPDRKETGRAAVAVTLEELTTHAGAHEGTEVTTTGQFRGANLFGDLPTAGRHGGSDWVLRDGPCAVWVTGKKPKGEGWSFDPKLRSDTGRWLRVTGRVSTSGGVVAIRAVSMSLTRNPSAESQLAGP